MLFAEKGFWDVLGEQSPVVITNLLTTCVFAYFGLQLVKWIVPRYIDPIIEATHTTASNTADIKRSNADIKQSNEEIKKSNSKILDAMAEWPSDIPKKLAEAKCASTCNFPPIDRDQVEAILRGKGA